MSLLWKGEEEQPSGFYQTDINSQQEDLSERYRKLWKRNEHRINKLDRKDKLEMIKFYSNTSSNLDSFDASITFGCMTSLIALYSLIYTASNGTFPNIIEHGVYTLVFFLGAVIIMAKGREMIIKSRYSYHKENFNKLLEILEDKSNN